MSEGALIKAGVLDVCINGGLRQHVGSVFSARISALGGALAIFLYDRALNGRREEFCKHWIGQGHNGVGQLPSLN